jgi:uncharacterized protein (DUF111 family)
VILNTSKHVKDAASVLFFQGSLVISYIFFYDLLCLQESEKTFQTNQVEFEEVQVHLNELKQSKILTSPEFQEEFQDDCKEIAIDRAQILKQTRDHKNKYVLNET